MIYEADFASQNIKYIDSPESLHSLIVSSIIRAEFKGDVLL